MTTFNGLSDNVFHQVADAAGGGAIPTPTTTDTDKKTDGEEDKAKKPGFEDKGASGGIRIGIHTLSPMLIETEALSVPDYRWIGQAAKLGLTIDGLIGPAWATGAKNNGIFALEFGPSYSYSPYKMDWKPTYNPNSESSDGEQDATTRLQVHRLAAKMQASWLGRIEGSDWVAGGHLSASVGGLFYANSVGHLLVSDRDQDHLYVLTGENRFKSPVSVEIAAGGQVGHKNVRWFAEGYVHFQAASPAMNEITRGNEFWENPANAYDLDSDGGVGSIWAHPAGGIVEGGFRTGFHFGGGPNVQAPEETKEPETKAPVETRDPR